MSSDALSIECHRGKYDVSFGSVAAEAFQRVPSVPTHLLIDARVAHLHAELLAPLLAMPSVLRIDATEQAKSLECMPSYVEQLVAARVRRGHELLCIGGGILQDITCFLAATLLRGLPWSFIPTTLLAQADSCIGSKSSINVGYAKNILGTFTPPERVHVWPGFLDTLDERDVRSGIGEILKVHAIAGPAAFDAIARDYGRLLSDRALLLGYVRRSLEIKKQFIEEDEFDRGARNVLNYGHSFGHAIEGATRFRVPHGIAVTMGMDLANFIASRRGLTSVENYQRMHPTLRANYEACASTEIDAAAVVEALGKDKKNKDGEWRLVLPDVDGMIRVVGVPADEALRAGIELFLQEERFR